MTGVLRITCPRTGQPCESTGCFNGTRCRYDPVPGMPAQPIFSNPGWTCPRCGRGNAPSTATCPCVPPEPVRITC